MHTPLAAFFLSLLALVGCSASASLPPGVVPCPEETSRERALAERSQYRPVTRADSTLPVADVCQLAVRRMYAGMGDNPKNSSAFLLGDDLLVTAGHNVYSYPLSSVRGGALRCGGTPDDPDWQDTAPPFGRANVDVAGGYWFGVKFLIAPPASRDYAVIRLAEPMPSESAFQLMGPEDRLACGDTVYVAGHPSENGRPADQMHIAEGVVTGITPTALYYAIETEGGNSGGPVWIERADGTPVVVGVHILPGRARLITSEVADDVQRWRQEPGGRGADR